MRYQIGNRSADTPVWIDANTWACRRHVPSAWFNAAAEKCLLGCKVIRPDNRPGQEPVTVTPPEPELPEPQEPDLPEPELPLHQPADEEPEPEPSWYGLVKMTEAKLREQGLGDLRKYARHHLGIVGASKIPGGKDTLVQLILQARAA